MRRLLLFATLAAAAGGFAMHAQVYPNFTAWMKSARTAAGTLGKLETKTGEKAVENAEEMAGIYENMIGFWRQHEEPDAVKWSETGKAAALELMNAAHSGDAEKADAAYKAVSETCHSCHEAHREKLADGAYRIKFTPPPEPRPRRSLAPAAKP